MGLAQEFGIKKSDKKKYIFIERRDYEILSKIYKLEKLNLSDNDEMLVRFIRTQLKRDWRKPIIQTLNKLFKKYKK